MQRQRTMVTGAIAALFLSTGGAVAAQAASMTAAQVTARLQAAGYTHVRDVEREGGHFDADAMKNGQSVHLHVDAATGAITRIAHEAEEENEEHAHHRH